MAELPTLQALWSTPWEWNFFMFCHNITVLLLWKCSHEPKISNLYLKVKARVVAKLLSKHMQFQEEKVY
jgi:hypothetical protein